MRAGIQNDMIFTKFPEFRVSLKIVLLARSKIPTSSAGNDSFFEL
jgi:hypothetical protein